MLKPFCCFDDDGLPLCKGLVLYEGVQTVKAVVYSPRVAVRANEDHVTCLPCGKYAGALVLCVEVSKFSAKISEARKVIFQSANFGLE